jgi:glyoxylase-like metal-dependent hydrolase (beta-lactamase superfamily II)
MNPIIEAFFDEKTFTVTYLVSDPNSRRAVIIDPVLDYDPRSARTSTGSADAILDAIKKKSLVVEWILETHAHADHLSAGAYLSERLCTKVAIGEHIKDVQKVFRPIFNAMDVSGEGSEFDRLLKDGEKLQIGGMTIEALHTPGHTPGCMSYKIGDNVFVGDTVFMPDYGTARCDFPGGDAKQLHRSIKRIFSYPPETALWMCHDYKPVGREVYAWRSTVSEQRAKNIHIHDGVTEEEFTEMRRARDKTLDKPVLILPSIQVNIRAGNMPPPEPDGHVYLKLPLNRF